MRRTTAVKLATNSNSTVPEPAHGDCSGKLSSRGSVWTTDTPSPPPAPRTPRDDEPVNSVSDVARGNHECRGDHVVRRRQRVHHAVTRGQVVRARVRDP